MKKCKRLLSFFLSLLLIFSAVPSNVFAVLGSAEDIAGAPIEFTVTDVKGVANKSVHVEVRVSEDSQIASLGLELNFDSSKLLVVDYAAGEVLSGGLAAVNGNVSDKVILSFATMEPLTEAGTILSVDFDITTADVNDMIDMYVTATEITDINGNDLTSTAAAGTIEIVDLLYGDINFDNKITSLDALMLLSAATEEISLGEMETQAGDVNGDGEVTVSDALQILYFSAEVVEDFQIYHLNAPENLHLTNLDGYQFTVEWDYCKDVLGYNVYLDGKQVNEALLTQNSVAIGVDMDGGYGSDLIPQLVHDQIRQVTTYQIEVTAVNALKESDKCATLPVTTKRIWSWVTFVDWDGTVLKKSRVYYGDDAVKPSDPTRADYFFIGWDKPVTNIIDDTVITALYEDAHYDFIFLNEDGRELYRQNVTVNGKATPPADPIKPGHSFAGWYTSPSGGTKVQDFTITSATGARTVYAHYTINSYPVIFATNGGTAVSQKTAVYQTKITAPADPTRLGYGFGGWYKDRNCTHKWNFNTDVVTAQTTLYAKWNPVVITIDKPSVTLNEIGFTAQLTATITGGSDTLEWSTSNPAIAVVDQNGKITAKGHGTATIYVKGSSSSRRPVTLVTVNVAKTAWVTADALKIRSGPSTSYSVVGTSYSRDKITVYGNKVAAGVDGQSGWYSMKAGNVYGYVSADYVTFTEPPAYITVSSFGQERNVNGIIYYTLSGFDRYIICQNQFDGNVFRYGPYNWGCTATSSSMVIAMCTGRAPANPTTSYYWGPGGATWNGLRLLAGSGSSASTVYSVVADQLINHKKPCVVYFEHGTGPHAVVAVGIRKGANRYALRQSDILIVDPWNLSYAAYPSAARQVKPLSAYYIVGFHSVRTYNG